MMYRSIFLIFLTFYLLISCSKKEDNKPMDFNDFWEQTINELNTVPFEFEKINKDSIIDGKTISLYRIRSFQDIYFYAWISVPIHEGNFPIKIRFSGFGKGEINKNIFPYLWFLKQKNTINMTVDIRGQGLSTDQIKFKNYLTNGLNNKDDYIYRGAYMDAVRSVDFVSKNSKSDGNIIVMGGSQGGALSVVAAALNKKVTMCISGYPFLTNMPEYNKNKWPMNILIHHSTINNIDYFDLKNTLSYFDILNFSDQIEVPILIKAEENDEITPVSGSLKLFTKIIGQKKMMYVDPCKGHGCVTKSVVANEIEKIFIKNNLSNY